MEQVCLPESRQRKDTLRKLVFIGNCQIGALMSLYSDYASQSRHEILYNINAFAPLSNQDIEAIEGADVVVDQVYDTDSPVNVAEFSSSHRSVSVPTVAGGFFWPFGGQAHPRNTPNFGDNGAFPSELGDSYLNRLIGQGAGAEAAVVQYLNADINRVINLDRLLEIYIERQTLRDQKSGFEIAQLIVDYFRVEPLFLTPFHPGLRLTLALAGELFRRLDVPEGEIAIMNRHLCRTPFPRDELPIHPSVAAHFELAFGGAEQRYRLAPEGRFTFAEYALRYMRYDINLALREGGWRASRGELDAAIMLLQRGLAQCPHSQDGWAALADALARQGRLDEAISAISTAMAIDPNCSDFVIVKAGLLAKAGQWQEAVEAARTAVSLEPGNVHHRRALSDVLWGCGDVSAATETLLTVIHASPPNCALELRLAELLAQAGHDLEAVSAAERAIALEPEDCAPAYNHLSHALERLGRSEDAMRAAQRALETAHPMPVYHWHLASLLANAGRSDEAVVQRERAAALEGNVG